ncbi:MAG TPA: GNAT family N-acetyltransferase [Gemmatimonadaceae bacterium]|nr:GNAT family N-acetyltransferase [Gemmatimonadaceae bacterium]
MNDRVVEDRRGDLLLSTDRTRIDVNAVLAWLHASHWGWSMTRELLERAIENSMCVAVYRDAEQLSFLRVVTDLSTFAYFTDVIVAESARGQGLGSWMVEAVLTHPDLQGLRRFALLTRDAQGLYERFGFSATDLSASTYMELRPPRR